MRTNFLISWKISLNFHLYVRISHSYCEYLWKFIFSHYVRMHIYMYKEIVQDIFNCYNNFYISLFQYRLNIESKNKDCHIKWKKNHFKTLSCTSSSFHKYSQTKKKYICNICVKSTKFSKNIFNCRYFCSRYWARYYLP